MEFPLFPTFFFIETTIENALMGIPSLPKYSFSCWEETLLIFIKMKKQCHRGLFSFRCLDLLVRDYTQKKIKKKFPSSRPSTHFFLRVFFWPRIVWYIFWTKKVFRQLPWNHESWLDFPKPWNSLYLYILFFERMGCKQNSTKKKKGKKKDKMFFFWYKYWFFFYSYVFTS